MKALVWHGKSDVRCDNVPDPKIEDSAANCEDEESADNCGCYGLGSFPSPVAALRIPADLTGLTGARRPRRGASARR